MRRESITKKYERMCKAVQCLIGDMSDIYYCEFCGTFEEYEHEDCGGKRPINVWRINTPDDLLRTQPK